MTRWLAESSEDHSTSTFYDQTCLVRAGSPLLSPDPKISAPCQLPVLFLTKGTWSSCLLILSFCSKKIRALKTSFTLLLLSVPQFHTHSHLLASSL